MTCIRFMARNIISNCILYTKKYPSHTFTRLLSTSQISFKKVEEEPEIEDYLRLSLDEEEESASDGIKRKFVLEESNYVHLPDKLPLMRNYKKVAVLLPWVKWGPNKRNVSPDLLLEEACALINSIPDMEIVYSEIVNLTRMVQSKIFTSGIFERLVEEVNSIECDAIFISLNYLNFIEIKNLQEGFRLPVFDRFMVVLDIFRYHARSSEAKMQIELAEMPHLRRGIITEEQKMWAHAHKHALTTKLEKVSYLRQNLRAKRKKLSHDSIAVIGYTNCGKTTLIRGITRDFRLIGENRLFATLDVTSHPTVLPCGLKSYFVDTVGFIQDIPTNLIASFRTTLEDAIYADVIVYMRDLSHPDFAQQDKTVLDTIASMDIPATTPLIVVNSKCDLVDEDQMEQLKDEHNLENSYNISAISGEGIVSLLRLIESKLLEVTGRKKLRLRLLNGSDKISWLKDTIGIQEEVVDQEDINYCKVIVAMNSTEIAAYRKKFKK